MQPNQLVPASDTEADQMLARWVDEHADALFRFALSKVRDQHAIEDLLQETYLAALRGQHAFRGQSTVRSWLIAILRLKIIDYYRRKSKRREIEFAQAGDSDSGFRRDEALTKWDASVENSVENQEFWKVFHSCVGKLPESLARAYLMRELDRCSPTVVCETLEISLDPTQDRFFSYASMVIPSNDSFVGTADSIEVFDATGNFIGGNEATYLIFGNQIWDAGTEVNNTFGAAFSDQSTIGQADEFGTFQLLGAGGLDNFLGTGTPIGTVTDPIGPTERLATITIASVPEPTSLLLGALTAGIVGLRRRRI